MTAVPFEGYAPTIESAPNRRTLTLVSNEQTYPYREGEASLRLFDECFELRDEALAVKKIQGEELEEVQEAARGFLLETGIVDLPVDPEARIAYYTDYNEDLTRKKILSFVDYLERNHADKVNVVELEATRAFIDSTYAMYQDGIEENRVIADADGSFAFVVPARVGRDHADYGKEVEPPLPALRYVPNELRAAMMAGLPPFVIDTYQRSEDGKRGYLVFAPVFEDMRTDLADVRNPMQYLRKNVNDAVDFARRRFGVEVVGLGATLPAITRYGKEITNPDVITTTGHAGTVDLIRDTVELNADGRRLKKIGVLGLGSIGESIVRVMAEEHPEATIAVYDRQSALIGRATRDASVLENGEKQIIAMENEKAVIDTSEVVISAITSQLDLKTLGIQSLEGKIIVDDSQPGSMTPEQVKELGGTLLWVIGRDVNGRVANRRGYDYATMVDSRTDVFGCEAEAASISAYRAELRTRGMTESVINRITDKIALKGPVTVQHVRYMSALFTKFGILPSEPQAFGLSVAARHS
ncbi:MAG TPA: NAD(P)-binding domain-containing protein [Candidatus Saccharimonadales bacterium]